MDILSIINRERSLFGTDIEQHSHFINDEVANSSFLIIGAAGSIGKAVTKEIFKRNPKKLHAIDISENNLVELVRDLRSSIGYISGEFKTFCIDFGSEEFEALLAIEKDYDYVLNLSALKHVRSEKDPFSLMRLIRVNIINTLKSIQLIRATKCKKYFCVSTDKAANPVNMMGASKKIMEEFLKLESEQQTISTARFANVAFSDGSLLHGFTQRLLYQQPLSVPVDVLRYFVTPEESGQLCLLSTILGKNRQIFFPKESMELQLTSFVDIANNFVLEHGYEPYFCNDEAFARSEASDLIKKGKWPIFTFTSDTTGEKVFEEFYTQSECPDMQQFSTVGIITMDKLEDEHKLHEFTASVMKFIDDRSWSKADLLAIFQNILSDFDHMEQGKFLDDKM